ncbi:MAG: hypothetical protein AB1453_13985 [Chloroflexota bacterium]
MNHQGKKPFLIIESGCSQFLATFKDKLEAAGYSVVQSFDLSSTRALHEGCACPYHGSELCTCELVVLLLYRAAGDPLTLTLDGRDERTFVYLNEEPGEPLRSAIIKAAEQVFRQTPESSEQQRRVSGVVQELSS